MLKNSHALKLWSSMQPGPRFCIAAIQGSTYLLSDWLVCEITCGDCDVPFHRMAADSLSWPPAARDLDEVYHWEMALLWAGSQMRRNHMKSKEPEKEKRNPMFYIPRGTNIQFLHTVTIYRINLGSRYEFIGISISFNDFEIFPQTNMTNNAWQCRLHILPYLRLTKSSF